ncbi:hypothetical protein [Sphingomonas aerolata]|uniref:hypothetical protein n=1 Tax=Sphingomonas aerolata TaxID=185951 RepID=UPI00141A9F49|nr:hypothetical protein [Sphingomonas aerolata]NII58981.1 hypothetical protein [Sphingomonas aerolata]
MTEPKLKDLIPVNASMFAADAALSRARFEYLANRRDQMLDRLRFGYTALNSASLLGLVGMLGGDGKAAAWVGFNPERARQSAAAFALGIIITGVASWIEGERYRTEAGDAFARQSAATTLVALYEGPADEANRERAGKALEAYSKLPLVDFQYSAVAIALQNIGGACWLFGIGVPLSNLLGW